MKVVLIKPPVVNFRNSPFGSVPGVPTNMAYLAAVLRESGHHIAVVDAYGLAPHRFTEYRDKFEIRGLLPHEIVEYVPEGVDVLGVSVHCTLEHSICISIIEECVKAFPGVTIVVGGYHTTFTVDPFLDAGADYVLQGEGEHRFPNLLRLIESGVEFEYDGIHGHGYNRDREPEVCSIENFPFGFFDVLPLETYWKLRYAHGPVQSDRYLSIFTSRGCPYNCAFCQTPQMWGLKWMAKSPGRIVDEMDYYHSRYGVSDFHIQDENFSLSRDRTREFAFELLRRKRHYKFCFPSGVKAETLTRDELELLRSTGCYYLCISPESASAKVLEAMNKPVDLDHMANIVKWCDELGIRINSNFVLGFPGEEKIDRKMTYRFVRKLSRLGLDEIIAFMLTPLPKTQMAYLMPEGLEFEEINFSPTWRENYRLITRARLWIYLQFFAIKLLYHPGKILENILCVFRRRFQLKGDMTVYRLLVDLWDRHIRPLLHEDNPVITDPPKFYPPEERNS